MAEISDLNVTDASNTARFPEGQAPSTVNNGARALEGLIARWARDFGDGFVTTGGSSTAYTAASNRTISSYYDGLALILELHTAAGASPTLNVDSVGAQSMVWPDGTAVSSDLPAGLCIVCYDLTNTNWVVLSVARPPDLVNDTTPQLGGQLDVNGNALGDGTNELLAFSEAGSAVNEITVGNAATGNAPSLAATGDDTNIDLELTPKGTGNVTAGGNAVRVAGKETIWVPAGAMVPSATLTPAGPNDTELATQYVMVRTLDFDASATEWAQFPVAMPKSWDEGTVTAQFYWTHGATTTNFGVVWGCRGVAFSDGDALDVAFGTPQFVTDTGGTANDLYISDETGAVTLAGSPAAGDLVTFVFGRSASDGSDTLAIDAKLIGVKIFYTTDAANDA